MDIEKNTIRLLQILENVPITVFHQDRDLRYTWIHNLQVNMKPDDIIGKTDADFVPPEHAARLHEIKSAVISSGKSVKTEIAVKVMGIDYFYVMIVNPVKDSKENVTGLTGVTWDISDQRQSENALKELNEKLEERVTERTAELLRTNSVLRAMEEKYRTVADFTYDWEYWINNKGGYNYVSPSCYRITGYHASEFIDDQALMERIVHPDDRRLFRHHVYHQLQERKPCEIEFRILRKDGAERWIAHACQPVYGTNGEFLGKRGSNRDITEKVKAERELLNVTIAVEEKERNRFSRDLHDGLGPLLSTIKLYFEWFASTDDPDKIRMITGNVNASIERAIQTTREVAHGLASQYLTESGFVNAISAFARLINDTEKLHIGFTHRCPVRFSNILEITLYRITTELVNNTLTHGDATRVRIHVSFSKTAKQVRLTYQDNGRGFDFDELEQQGGGFGLMNIRQRIKVLGGDLQIRTAPGKGVNIKLMLPVTEAIDVT